jgi:formylglycine-generating enzyme required for sulfatase activity
MNILKTLTVVLLTSILPCNASQSIPHKTPAGIQFVPIPGSSFMMEIGSHDVNVPTNKKRVNVTLSEFLISRTEVTWGQWMNVFGKTSAENRLGRSLRDDELEMPVTNVSYYEIVAFCRVLTAILVSDGFESGQVLLPTEAQWEYVAMADKNITGIIADRRKYLTGRENFETNAPWKCGSGQANELGVFDMLGNVFEFVRDVYSDTLITGTDPVRIGSADIWNLRLTIKGGCFGRPVSWCYFSERNSAEPHFKSEETGFRVVWERTRK